MRDSVQRLPPQSVCIPMRPALPHRLLGCRTTFTASASSSRPSTNTSSDSLQHSHLPQYTSP